ncbi:MAG: peptidogalycan biosysnthesis protein, partial [Henriciella sp.]
MENKRSKIRLLNSLAEIDPAEWDAVANPAGEQYDPFLSWAFLDALETSSAATPDTGWTPCHVVIDDAHGVAQGVMPLYAKTHSRGEFVFDYAWADAYHRAGGDYYPKLLGAVPFTPVTGRRLLVRPDADPDALEQALISAAVELAAQNDLSSLHLNFITPETAKRLESFGLLVRTDQQFHWENQNYVDFDDFLAQLSSAKRKNLRKERKKAQDGLKFKHLTGAAITEAHWDAFY